ncbi:transcriptional regulatory protein ZraR [bacterium BMS3Abin05]|nr:transcriptional regulatory protein ZraR [bacterium BMS3Abin05]
MTKGKVLIVDDDKLICWSLEQVLNKEGYDVTFVHLANDALSEIFKEPPDILLLDLLLPDLSGVEVLKRLKKKDYHIPVLVISAMATVDSAVQAMKLGAYDYISKPFNMDAVKLAIQKALEVDHLRSEVDYHRTRESRIYGFNNFVSGHSSIRELLRMARRVASSEAPTILIQGESGTGKDLLARVIHYQSKRANSPLVELNCTAVPETLLESELFGHEQGAFTDAKKMKRGLFEIANKGTILLEEIGEIPQPIQVKLLKVLEDRRLRRVGGLKNIAIDVRVIATTNRDLIAETKAGNFRTDLFYRLNVITLLIPPLRERKGDILLLTKYFLNRYNHQFHRNIKSLSKEAEKLLINYNWPGNIRQLKNVLERIMILEDTEELLPDHLPYEIQSYTGDEAHAQAFIKLPHIGLKLGEVEKNLINQALDYTEGNQVQAAKLLGISRDALRRKMIKFKLI